MADDGRRVGGSLTGLLCATAALAPILFNPVRPEGEVQCVGRCESVYPSNCRTIQAGTGVLGSVPACLKADVTKQEKPASL